MKRTIVALILILFALHNMEGKPRSPNVTDIEKKSIKELKLNSKISKRKALDITFSAIAIAGYGSMAFAPNPVSFAVGTAGVACLLIKRIYFKIRDIEHNLNHKNARNGSCRTNKLGEAIEIFNRK